MAIEPSAANRRARIIGLTPDGLSRMEAATPLWQGTQTRFEESFAEAGRPGRAARLRASLEAVFQTGFTSWAE
ncbi:MULTISPECIES: hypothetical protein [unclassified Streptomyces]|uniref:hypothetical protein n=1 Tax=unclassified Streptomyces TaxID=2593676 RepID=UPI003D90982C